VSKIDFVIASEGMSSEGATSLEPSAPVFAIFYLATLVIIGAVLRRIFRAFCGKHAIGENIRILIIGVGGLLFFALALRSIVAAVEEWHQRQQADARFQVEREERRKRGELLSLEDLKRLQELCPPDRIIEFSIGTKSFYLPWRWIRGQQSMATSVWASTAGAACPTEPVQKRDLFFQPPDPEIVRERDLNLFSVRVEFYEWMNNWRKNHPDVAPSNPASRITDPDGSYLEDVTDEWRASHNNPPYIKSDFQAYLLQQAAAVGRTPAAPVEMTCGTLNPKMVTRSCSARFWYDDLTVEYSFYTKQRPRIHHDEILRLPDGPAEPEGFLRFDARVHEWIEDLQKKP
jgi:hypothetical protein